MKPRTGLPRGGRGGFVRRPESKPSRSIMPDPITERLARCYTGVVHDVMRGMGLKDFTFPAELRPLVSDAPLAGPVFTVLGKVDPKADAHQTLVEWTGLLSRAKPGHI